MGHVPVNTQPLNGDNARTSKLKTIFYLFDIKYFRIILSALSSNFIIMNFKKTIVLLVVFMLSFGVVNAQIEVVHAKVKDFKATGFGSFLNFAIPASEANFVTLEGGLQYLKNKDDEELGLFPVLLGFRYTLNQSGSGFYLEPNAGYTFGSSTIGVYENDSPVSDGNGNWLEEKVAGPTAGIGFGYLFEPGGRVQFNLGLRYQHTFGDAPVNAISFRISHAFSFGKRDY